MRPTTRQQDEMTRLIEPQIPALRRYARLLTHDPASVDDLVQDCLERALQRWRSRREGTEVRPWLFAILHNIAIDHIRSTRRRGPHLPLDDIEDGMAARAMQEDALRRDDILGFVDSLPDEQRTVMLLIAIEEMSYGEAAAVLQVPLGTIMSRLHRARDRLRQLMTANPVAAPTLRIVR